MTQHTAHTAHTVTTNVDAVTAAHAAERVTVKRDGAVMRDGALIGYVGRYSYSADVTDFPRSGWAAMVDGAREATEGFSTRRAAVSYLLMASRWLELETARECDALAQEAQQAAEQAEQAPALGEHWQQLEAQAAALELEADTRDEAAAGLEITGWYWEAEQARGQAADARRAAQAARARLEAAQRTQRYAAEQLEQAENYAQQARAQRLEAAELEAAGALEAASRAQRAAETTDALEADAALGAALFAAVLLELEAPEQAPAPIDWDALGAPRTDEQHAQEASARALGDRAQAYALEAHAQARRAVRWHRSGLQRLEAGAPVTGARLEIREAIRDAGRALAAVVAAGVELEQLEATAGHGTRLQRYVVASHAAVSTAREQLEQLTQAERAQAAQQA